MLGLTRREAWGPSAECGGGAGQVVEVTSLGLVELQRGGEPLEDRLGRTTEVSALQPYQTVGTDARQDRQLFSTQPWNPPVAAVDGQASGLGCQPVAPGHQEIAHLGADVGRVLHGFDGTSALRCLGGTDIRRSVRVLRRHLPVLSTASSARYGATPASAPAN